MDSRRRVYQYLSAAVVALFLLTGILTLSDYGMGWDENIRWRYGDLKLEYYQSLFSGDAEEMREIMINDRYPGLFDLPLAVFHTVFGGDRMIQGHAWSLLFGVLGLVAIHWLANTVFDYRTAFFSTLLLAVLPHFYGHAMMNPKDIPFMATYCLGLASVMWITRKLLDGDRIHWLAYLACGLAIGLAASSRVPGVVLLGMAGFAWLGAILWNAREIRLISIAVWFKGCLITGTSALTVLLVFFPRLHFQFFSGISRVTSALHSSAGEIPLLFAGRAMNAIDAPAYYAPMFFLISTPIWMLILLGAGIYFSAKACVAEHRHLTFRNILVSLFLLFSAFPWIYILVTRPALHNGIRHLLFGIPPLVVLMGYALHRVLTLLQSQPARIRAIAIGLIVLLMANQVVSLVRMHPYEYVSFNFLAGNKATVINRFEGEYWFTSSRHLLEALAEYVQKSPIPSASSGPVKVRIAGPLTAARPFVPEGIALVDTFYEADFYIANTTFRTDLLAEGDLVYQITRRGIPIGVIKKLKSEDLNAGP